MNATFVHQPQASLRVEGTLMHPVEAPLQRIEEGKLRTVSCDDTPSAGEPDLVSVDDPRCQTIALLHVEYAVLVALRGPAGPKVVRLRVVGICINDLEVLSQLCHVMTFPDSSNVREPSNPESRALDPSRQAQAEKMVRAPGHHRWERGRPWSSPSELPGGTPRRLRARERRDTAQKDRTLRKDAEIVIIGGQSWRGAYIALYRRAPKEHYLGVCGGVSDCSNLSTSKSWLACEDAGHDPVGGALTSFCRDATRHEHERAAWCLAERAPDRPGSSRSHRRRSLSRDLPVDPPYLHGYGGPERPGLGVLGSCRPRLRKTSPAEHVLQSGAPVRRPRAWRCTTLERYFQRPHFPCARSSRINSASTASRPSIVRQATSRPALAASFSFFAKRAASAFLKPSRLGR